MNQTPSYQATLLTAAGIVDAPNDRSRMFALFAHAGACFGASIVTGGLVYLLRRRRDPFAALHGLQAFWNGVYLAIAMLLGFFVFGAGMLLTMVRAPALEWIGLGISFVSMFVLFVLWCASMFISAAGMLEAVCGRATLLPYVGLPAAMKLSGRE